MAAGFGYNALSNVPYDADATPAHLQSAPFNLTKNYWESMVYHGMYHDMMFTDLVGVRGSGAAIVYDATPVQPGGFVRVPMRRPAPKSTTYTALGDNFVVNYAAPASSRTTDMSWAYLDVYASRARHAWQSLGKESNRMLKDYGLMSEATTFLSELHRQDMEYAVITALRDGYSRNLTSTITSGDITGTPYGLAARLSLKTFDRLNLVGTYDITGLSHPNALFPYTSSLLASGTLTEAQSKAAVQTAQYGLTVDVLENLIPSLRARKIAPIQTPAGLKWLMIVHPNVAAALRQDSDFREQQLNAAPRDYNSNVLWKAEVGVVSNFYIVESQYIDADGTSTSTYPCYILGQNALALSQPEAMTMSANDTLDGDNWTILFAATTYGLCRADWLRDSTSAYTTNIAAQDGAAFDDTAATVNAFNNSSAVLWVYAPGGNIA